MKLKSIVYNRFEIVKCVTMTPKIWSMDILKLLDMKIVSRGIFYFRYGQDSYYLKWIKNKLEYKVGKELASLNRKEFLLPVCLFEEKPSEKRPLIKHVYQKDYYYMVTKEMEGEELDQVIPRLTTEEFKKVVGQIIDALEYAWNQIKFVHGDLHLRNIFVNKDLEPMIFDFEHATVHNIHPKKTFEKDLWIFLTNLALNVKNEKSEIVMQFVDHYFQERTKFQESLYACVVNF